MEAGFAPEKVQSIKEGDHDAFRELYFMYSDSMVFFLSKLLGSEDAAKDVVQDTFAMLWEKRDQIDPSKNIKGYLYIVAKHASFRFVKRNSIFKVLDLSLETAMGEMSNASDENVIARETELLVEIAVSRMPSLRRSIYSMSRKEGMSNEEIAKQLGVTRESVASHLYNALKDIRGVVGAFMAVFALSDLL